MKLALATLAVIAVAYGAVLPQHATTYGLKEDFNRFVDLLPKNEIVGVVLDYLANDKEVQDVFEYVQSGDFKNLIIEVENVQEYHNFLRYLQNNGLNVYYYVQKLHEFLNLPEFQPRAISTRRGTGIRGLINDIEALLPMAEIKALYYELMETSPAFQNLVEVLKGDDFKTMIEDLRANPEFIKIVQKAKEHGVDVQVIVELLNKIFGWGIQSRAITFGLQDDLQDFLALVPVDQILGIAMDYLTNDKDVQDVVEFAQSEEFKKLVKEVEAVPEYIQFLNYLQKSGLDVYSAVNMLHEFLGLPPLSTPQSRSGRRGQGIRGLIDDILAVIPTDKIQALFNEKMHSSTEFANLVKLLQGEEFKGMIEKLRQNPTFQKIIAEAKAHGIDVTKIVEILNKIFGWGIQSRAITFGLQDDLQDFLALVPVDQILGIAMDYLTNDKEVQDVVEFAQSEEFKKLVKEVEAVPEYIQFLNYLQKSGLDVYSAVNMLHEFLGLPPLSTPQSRSGRRGQGIRGLIDDILAVIPTDKIQALFNEKMHSSTEFANLVKLLQGEEFKGMIEKLRQNPTFQKIIAEAKAHGIDVTKIVEILNKIFGWGIQSRAITFGLQDDLQEFWDLVPVDEIFGVILDYMINDKEVQEVFEFSRTEEFQKMVETINAVPEYVQLLNFLQKNGFDIYEALNKLHEILGLPPFPVPQFSLARKGQGMRGLIDDILDVVPSDKIEALFYKKMATSPEFVNLMKVLRGEELKGMIENLRQNQTFQKTIADAKAHGIDVAHIVELMIKIFGWALEPRAFTFGLQDDLQDFLALVPVDEILGVAMDYLANDEEVQEVFEFVQSGEFKQLVQAVDAVPEYVDFLNYLQKNGLDVYSAVNMLHEFLGLATLPIPQARSARKGQGIRGLIDDILAILPTDEIQALFYKKLETSPEFASLVNLLKGEEFKGMIEKLSQNPTFQKIIVDAKAHGIDVSQIVEILNKIFGWGIQY